MTIDLNIYQLIEIFEFLNLEERLVCLKVCKKWRSAINYLGIQQLIIYFFTEPNCGNNSELDLQNENQLINSLSKREDARFKIKIKKDKLFEMLDNTLFRKIRSLKIYANNSLQLADCYINLTQLKSLESLIIDNRSLCLCLSMCLERDRMKFENLKFINLFKIKLICLIKHFPNLIGIKCNQIDCNDRVKLDELNNEDNIKIKWLDFELNGSMEISDYFFAFLIENCLLIENLSINLTDLDEAILLVRNLKSLKRLKFNCKIKEPTEFKVKLEELIRLINDLSNKDRNLKVQFNGLELNVNRQLNKYLIIKDQEFNNLYYFDLIKIDQLFRNMEIELPDLKSLFNWIKTIHIKQNLKSLRILSFDLNFVNVKQLFFKAFDQDEKINDEHLRLLFNKLPFLQSIDIDYVQRLSQTTLNCLSNGWPSLKELNLSSNLKKEINLEFLSSLNRLERAEFFACKFEEQTDLNELIVGLKYFCYLNITNCDNLINVDKIYITMYTKATINKRLEYNLNIDKPYSEFINQQFNKNLHFPQRRRSSLRNFFFIDLGDI